MDAPRPSRTPATERVTLYCTWRPSALTTRPRKQVIIYLTKNKIRAPCQTVITVWFAPKIYHGQPPTFGSECSKFHPNRFTIGGVAAERVKAVLWAHRVCAILRVTGHTLTWFVTVFMFSLLLSLHSVLLLLFLVHFL